VRKKTGGNGKVCDHCGTSFTARTTTTRFCSDFCAKRAYKRRKRLESAELTNSKSAQTLQENLEKNIPEVMEPRLAAEYMSVHVSTTYRYLACGILKAAQATAKHRLEVAAPINAVIRDTVFIRDTVQVVQQKIEMTSPHIQLDAVIDNDTLRGDIRLPVTLQQTVWVAYKRKCLFWKKVKVIHQTISSDNPYVDIKYSEYIQIDKK
jgi:hypothetical protein